MIVCRDENAAESKLTAFSSIDNMGKNNVGSKVMKEPVLVVMAAGMGSRYGGLKQIEPMGPSGESLMDYSLYDARLAGFKRVVFVIKKEMDKNFRETIGKRISSFFEIEYVYQDLGDIPSGFSVPETRMKPWGTGHAVWAARSVVDGPFAVINADDFYGRQAFSEIYKFLKNEKDPDRLEFALVGYRLENTLTENGSVSRGVCSFADGFLESITERKRIEKSKGGPQYSEDDGKTWVSLKPDEIVSMNLWGFTQGFIEALSKSFSTFLQRVAENLSEEEEFYLPFAVNELIKTKKVKVRLLTSEDQWYGITYKKDGPLVREMIGKMVENGRYQYGLWDTKSRCEKEEN